MVVSEPPEAVLSGRAGGDDGPAIWWCTTGLCAATDLSVIGLDRSSGGDPAVVMEVAAVSAGPGGVAVAAAMATLCLCYVYGKLSL